MEQTKQKRIAAIDRFRGLCMMTVCFQFILGAMGDTFASWSRLLEHDADGLQILPGIALADLFAPMFIFIIGYTLKITFESRERRLGTRRAYFDLALRFLSLMGFGAFLGMIEDGWFELLGGARFAEFPINRKIFMVCSVVAAVLLVVNLLAALLRKQSFSKLASAALRYFLSLMGAAVIFFIWVSASDRIIPKWNENVVPLRFGGYIWDTLENIGFACLIALPCLKLDKWGKLSCVLAVFFMYTVYVQAGGIYMIRNMVEGAPFAGVCWAGIAVLGAFFKELREKPKQYWGFALGMIAASVLLITVFGLIGAKRGCTPVYALLCSGVGAVILGLLGKLEDWKPGVKLFSWWGGSCILTYSLILIFSLIIGYIFDTKELLLSVPAGLGLALAVFCLLSLINYLLARGDRHIKL